MGLCSQLRPLLVPLGNGGLGALSVRAMVMVGLLWLDLGQPRPLGLGSLPLRALVPPRPFRLGLVSRLLLLPSPLATGPGGLFRVRRPWRARDRPGFEVRTLRLDSAGARGALLPLVWPSFSPPPRAGQARLYRPGRQPDQYLQQLSQCPPSQRHHPGRRPGILPRTNSECARPAGLRGKTGQPDAGPDSGRSRSRQPGTTCSESPPLGARCRLHRSNPLLFDRTRTAQHRPSLFRPAAPGDGPIRRFPGSKRHPGRAAGQCPLFHQARGGSFGARSTATGNDGQQVHGKIHQPAQPVVTVKSGGGPRPE